MTHAALLQRAAELLGSAATPALRLSFRDEDGDLVALSNDQDLAEALRQSSAAGKKLCTLIMQPKGGAKAAAAKPAGAKGAKAAAKAEEPKASEAAAAASAAAAAAAAEQEPSR
jgi:hypothetical protein